MPVSTRQIAKLAGVSPATVSLALRSSPKISKKTTQTVQRIAKRLGYRPNAKVAEMMAHLRLELAPQNDACFGVISFYDTPRPWENALHLDRIYEGMLSRATALGYRLEPFWIRAPGMTPGRLRRIMDTRGIQGLLCFGSPNIDEVMPQDFSHYAIVAQGISIKTPLHRVVSHANNGMWQVLNKVWQLGYRRPGLVLGEYEGLRTSHAYLCVYLGWCQLTFGGPPPMPTLHLKHVEQKPLADWLKRHQPDVLIVAHHYNALGEFERALHAERIRVPDDLGVAVITQVLEGTHFSGLQANRRLVGEWAVELLVGRIMNRDFGLPVSPRIEMVEMEWLDGKTLRRQKVRN